MKILMVGDWHSELHEEAACQALQQLGHEMERFPWHQYFKRQGMLGSLASPFFKAQNKFMLGPVVDRLNRDLVELAGRVQPDMVFIYRGSHVYQDTLRAIRRSLPGAILVGYNNDDPFSPLHPGWKWRHFLAGIPEYDLVLAYRYHNVQEFKAAGARHVELLRSWFIPEVNRPIQLTDADREKYACDVVFVGHYENDGRLECLEEIVRKGWRLKLFGHAREWSQPILRSDVLRSCHPLDTVWGDDYNKALCGAKIALCFLSKLNRDTYTRRCFEIPASGALLMSEFSNDLAKLFIEGEEAEYFRDGSELMSKVDLYLKNENLRERISSAGNLKVNQAGHDVRSRMADVMKLVEDKRAVR